MADATRKRRWITLPTPKSRAQNQKRETTPSITIDDFIAKFALLRLVYPLHFPQSHELILNRHERGMYASNLHVLRNHHIPVLP